jgi:hypothetical protein
MTLRIDITTEGRRVALRLVGRVQRENLGDLQHHLAGRGGEGVLDLDEVTLVDLDVVRFLEAAERGGIELRNCPPFVREWVDRERAAR